MTIKELEENIARLLSKTETGLDLAIWRSNY